MQLSKKATILVTFLVLLSYTGTAQSGIAFTKKIKTEGDCTYSVFKMDGEGMPWCDNFTFVGFVDKKNDISFTVTGNEICTIYVFLGKDDSDSCGELKTGFRISIDPAQTESETSIEVLEDETCK